MTDCRFSHCIFSIVLVAAQACRKRRSYLKHLFVKERNSQLERICHTHSVRFQQNIAHHPHIDVKILHLGNVVVFAAAIVVFACVILRRCCDGRVFEQFVLLLVIIHKRIADISFLKRIAGTDKVISALDVGELSANRTDSLAYAMRNNRLINLKNSRIVVAGIAAEQLVCTLARKHYLYILTCKARYKIQRNTGRIGKRLIHMILNGRNSVPELFA